MQKHDDLVVNQIAVVCENNVKFVLLKLIFLDFYFGLSCFCK
jgi:hypothetical protein